MRAPSSHEVFVGAALSRAPVDAYDCGQPSQRCPHCAATFFVGEAQYLNCCRQGTIVIARPAVPDELVTLITDSHVHSRIRQYNAALAMASIGYSGDVVRGNSHSAPGRPHVDGWGSLKISGRVYHLIGGAIPPAGQAPLWGQLYMFDAVEATNLRMTNSHCAANLLPAVLTDLHSLLQRHNRWVNEFVAVGASIADEITWSSDDVSMRSGIIAVLGRPGARSIVVRRISQQLSRISDQHPLYFPLAYVLLWPSGGVGYTDRMSRIDPCNGTVLGKLHMLEWARYLLMRRDDLSLIHLCGKLSLEFFCDVWSSIECRNLDYLASGAIQSQFRMARYNSLMDQLNCDGGHNIHRTGAPVLLPSSFAGSPRWYHALYLDALALPTAFHLPDLFVTVTFNPDWPELARMLPAHADIHDHPDVVARVFWLRFCRIMRDIVDNGVFGAVASYCWRIEWQLRGFPHSHVLLILARRILDAVEVDRIVSAEIPDPVTEPLLHQLVLQFMIHGPCDVTPSAPCVDKDGACEKGFPKLLQPRTIMIENAYPLYRRRAQYHGQIRGRAVTDMWVVPHNPYLLMRHRCHICTEVASHLILYKYVYKYCFKPPDKGAINFNEIMAFISGRILSSAEAVWRILQLPLHKEYPTVQRLSVHLPGHHAVTFEAAANADSASAAADAATSTLLQWFVLNSTQPAARSLLYKDVPQHYKWDKKMKKWQQRKHKGCKKVARLHGVSSHNVELFMLRRLLLIVPGAQSWDDLRTVDGRVYPSFESAVRARGMLSDDTELIAAFEEIVETTVCDMSIRRQFMLYLAFCRPADPAAFFARFRDALFPPASNLQRVWDELSCLASEFRVNFGSLGIVAPIRGGGSLPLLTLYDPVQSGADADGMWLNLNAEQRAVATSFLEAVTAPRGNPRIYMLQASGGCGKSYVCNYIAARVRSWGKAAICVAASAQAAAVLNGGRTAHGQLRIPIDCDEASYLDLKVNEKLEVAAAAALLWDEASMVSDVVADCVNRSLQDILQSPVPFGGMPVLFVGDWRQLLPVVPRSVGHHHTLQKCSWWHYVTLLKLHYNWRCQQPEWLQLLDDVGMGKLSSVQPVAASLRTTVEDVIAAVWPDAASSSTAQKAIITLRLEDAAEVNHHIISSLPNATMHAYSYDSFVDCKEPDLYPEEFIRSLRISGTPDGHLELKVGARYIIMRNLDQKMGIVNGAQIICTALTTRHVTGTILYGSFSGRTVVLPRTTAIINSQQSHLPFTVIRRQFPLIPGYSYTVHRSQGSSLEQLGFYFNGEPFCHGLLFTAMSRVKGDWSKITVYSSADSDYTISNCVAQHVICCLNE